MPRTRPKRVLCDCLDCQDASVSPGGALGWRAAASQDPPPKCLLIFIESSEVPCADAPSVNDHNNLPHLDGLAKNGATGILAVRPAGDTMSCLTQLLNTGKDVDRTCKATSEACPSLAERFQGLAVGIMSNCSRALAAAKTAGCSVCTPLRNTIPGTDGHTDLPDAKSSASAFQRVLGYQECLSRQGQKQQNAQEAQLLSPGIASIPDEDCHDMLIVHLSHQCGASECLRSSCSAGQSGSEHKRQSLLGWADMVVREIDGVPGVADTLLLVVLASVAEPALVDHWAGTAANAEALRSQGVRRPLQSYQFSGLEKVEIEQDPGVMMAARLKGVIRKDASEEFSIDQCKTGAAGGILLERLLPEIAYKLGRAPKYGA